VNLPLLFLQNRDDPVFLVVDSGQIASDRRDPPPSIACAANQIGSAGVQCGGRGWCDGGGSPPPTCRRRSAAVEGEGGRKRGTNNGRPGSRARMCVHLAKHFGEGTPGPPVNGTWLLTSAWSLTREWVPAAGMARLPVLN
jgi:hypothetical protein